MTRIAAAIVFAIAVLAPDLAEASSHCRETHKVVGYQRCGRFGQRWSTNGALAMEMGPTLLVFDPGSHAPRATAIGGVFGERFAFAPSGFYFGGDMAMAAIPSASPIGVARDTTAMPPATSPGAMGQAVFVVGTQRGFGRIGLGVEAGWGLRIAQLPGASQNDALLQFLIVTRARARVWLTPHWSINAQIGADLLHPGSYDAALLLGAHVVAYDNTR